jgi:cytochrome c oxidase subunit 3
LLLKRNAIPGLVMTVTLALVFEVAQYLEYSEATFSIRDGVYGRVFYFGTGFHGLHVMLGHAFLMFNLFRV